MRALDFLDSYTSASSPTAADGSVSQSLSNNVAATNVTGASISNATYRGGIFEMEVKRKTDSSERRSFLMMRVQYQESATSGWYSSGVVEDVMDGSSESGVTLTITTAGQVQYATDNHTGANYAATGKWRWVRRYSA